MRCSSRSPRMSAGAPEFRPPSRLMAEIDDVAAADAARRVHDGCARQATAVDAVLDAVDDTDEFVRRASDQRAECLHLAQRTGTGLLAAAGGRGTDLAHPAQRIAREADFYVIQVQTADGRAAALRSL
jgi:hypothetical protein